MKIPVSRLAKPERQNDIAIVTNTGNIVVLDVPQIVIDAIINSRPIPSYWTYGLTMMEFIIAPHFKTRLIRSYGESTATKIYNHIEFYLVGCKIDTKSIPKESDISGEFDI